MREQDPTNAGAKRVREHRERSALSGFKRVEVNVSENDEWLIRSVAKILRDDEEQATFIRNELSNLIPPQSEKSMVDFFRSSPLAEVAEELDLTRSKETGKPLSF